LNPSHHRTREECDIDSDHVLKKVPSSSQVFFLPVVKYPEDEDIPNAESSNETCVQAVDGLSVVDPSRFVYQPRFGNGD
jgi:hypothetical protein